MGCCLALVLSLRRSDQRHFSCQVVLLAQGRPSLHSIWHGREREVSARSILGVIVVDQSLLVVVAGVPGAVEKLLQRRLASYLPSVVLLQVESTLKDMALMLKAAVREALATDLTVSRTDLWNEAYGSAAEDKEVKELKQLHGGTGNPVLDEEQLCNLAMVSNERELVQFMLPILRSMFPQDHIVDSQDRTWPASKLRPDLFRCILYRQDPQKPEAGTPHEELLDCLDIFEGKMVIKDDGRGQLYEYLCRLPSKHSKGMVFDKKGFELIHVAGQESTRKALLQRIYGAWSDTGAEEVLRDFFLSTLHGNDCCGNLCDRLALFLFVSLAKTPREITLPSRPFLQAPPHSNSALQRRSKS